MVLSAAIPIEIIDTIISFVDDPWNRIYMLQRLSRVSHSFRVTCQKRLFSTVVVDLDDGIYPLEKLLGSFTANPRLPLYILCFKLIAMGCIAFRDDPHESELLSAILSQLPNLHTVTLDGSTDDPFFRIRWPSLPDILAQPLRALFALPNLATFKASDISGFPLDYLRQCSQLKRLVLHGIDTAERDRATSTLPDKFPILESLEIVDCDEDTVKVLQQAVDLSCLREFRVILKASCTTDIMEGSSQILECFAWLDRWPTPQSTFQIDLNAMPHLRILTLFADVNSVYTSGHNAQLRALTRALDTLAAKRTLEELHLVLYIDKNAEPDEMEALPPLDAVLAADSFPRLRQLHILVHPVDPPQPCIIPDVWMAHFRPLFPSLRAQGKLAVNWNVYESSYGDPTVATSQRISSDFFALPLRVD